MSVVEFKNQKGQVRYQPQHPDGRRLYPIGWMKPEDAAMYTSNNPKTYASRRRASRRVSELIAREYANELNRFREVR